MSVVKVGTGWFGFIGYPDAADDNESAIKQGHAGEKDNPEEILSISKGVLENRRTEFQLIDAHNPDAH